MRETLARVLAFATGVLLAALAAALAIQHNRPAAPVAVALEQGALALPDADRIARGHALYGELRCAVCHSIAGDGNPRAPLDGVGARLDGAAIRQWIVAGPAVEAALPARVRNMKADYRDLDDADLDALIAYLRSLPASPPSGG